MSYSVIFAEVIKVEEISGWEKKCYTEIDLQGGIPFPSKELGEGFYYDIRGDKLILATYTRTRRVDYWGPGRKEVEEAQVYFDKFWIRHGYLFQRGYYECETPEGTDKDPFEEEWDIWMFNLADLPIHVTVHYSGVEIVGLLGDEEIEGESTRREWSGKLEFDVVMKDGELRIKNLIHKDC